MKLDYDLLREILLLLEAESDGYINFSWKSFYRGCQSFQDSYDETTFRYHCKFLLDVGYIQDGSLEGFQDISPEGRAYLDNIRDNTIWEQTKKHIAKLGNVTLPIVSNVANSYVLKFLGLN